MTELWLTELCVAMAVRQRRAGLVAEPGALMRG
jgi:hypothetical protein